MIERAVILSETESLVLSPWFRTASVDSAERLGLKRTTLEYRMKKLGIHRDDR